MPLDFPTYAPGTNIGQTYSPAGTSKSWTWNGYQWDAVGGGSGGGSGSGTTNYIPKWTNSDTIGDSTALQNTDGDFVINGLTVGQGPGTGVNNTVFGSEALRSNTTGFSNVAVGYRALSSNLNSYSNTAVGTHALANFVDPLTDAGDNTAVGNNALAAMTAGNNNTALGDQTGFYLEYAVGNLFAGENAANGGAGGRLLSATKCVMVGAGSGNKNVPAGYHPENNIYIGFGAGPGDNVGESNTVRIGNADITENHFNGTVNTTANYRAGNGSVSTVAYGFADDTNTGIFSPANERISFSISGIQCMTNVGGSFYFGDIAKTVTSSWNVHDNTGDGNSTGIKIDGGDAIQISNAGPCLYLRNQLAENTGITNTIAFYGANSTSVDADYRGSIAINGNTISFNNVSDVRLKENIEDAPSCSEAIDKIKVRSFDWKSGKFPRVPYGFIAQELDEAVKYVAPGAVSKGTAETQDMWGVSTTELIPLLVKEIQDLRKRVAALEAK